MGARSPYLPAKSRGNHNTFWASDAKSDVFAGIAGDRRRLGRPLAGSPGRDPGERARRDMWHPITNR